MTTYPTILFPVPGPADNTGKVLTAVGDGTATWQTASGGGVTDIFVSAGSMAGISLNIPPAFPTLGTYANTLLSLVGWVSLGSSGGGDGTMTQVLFPADWHTYTATVYWTVESYTPSKTISWRLYGGDLGTGTWNPSVAAVPTTDPAANTMLTTVTGPHTISVSQLQLIAMIRLGPAIGANLGMYGLLLHKVT